MQLRKKVLFFPQNKTHLDNMSPVANALQAKGYDVSFLSASNIYKQNIYYDSFPFQIINIDLSTPVSFAFLSSFRKIIFLRNFVEYISLLRFNNYDYFIYGNDGALQRVFIAKYRRVKHFLILDGMISDYTFSMLSIFRFSDNPINDLKRKVRDILKSVLNKIFAYLPYNYYFPSDVGCSDLDKIFVLSDYINNAIYNQRIKKTDIITSGMPRYKFLNKNSLIDSPVKNIVYITEAFIWHNDRFSDVLQHKTIKLLVNHLKSNNSYDVKLTVRVHPRDDVRNYDYLFNESFVSVEDSQINIYETIQNSNIILGVNSTVMLEALYVEKKVIFLFFNNEYWRYERSFLTDLFFKKVFSEKELMTELMVENDCAVEKEKLEYYFNPNPEKSVDIIVNAITKND
jgi:hypothetical protein